MTDDLTMTLAELDELMSLKGWNQPTVAGHLNLTQSAISKWYERGRIPTGPAVILLRKWLIEARKLAARRAVGGR